MEVALKILDEEIRRELLVVTGMTLSVSPFVGDSILELQFGTKSVDAVSAIFETWKMFTDHAIDGFDNLSPSEQFNKLAEMDEFISYKIESQINGKTEVWNIGMAFPMKPELHGFRENPTVVLPIRVSRIKTDAQKPILPLLEALS